MSIPEEPASYKTALDKSFPKSMSSYLPKRWLRVRFTIRKFINLLSPRSRSIDLVVGRLLKEADKAKR